MTGFFLISGLTALTHKSKFIRKSIRHIFLNDKVWQSKQTDVFLQIMQLKLPNGIQYKITQIRSADVSLITAPKFTAHSFSNDVLLFGGVI